MSPRSKVPIARMEAVVTLRFFDEAGELIHESAPVTYAATEWPMTVRFDGPRLIYPSKEYARGHLRLDR